MGDSICGYDNKAEFTNFTKNSIPVNFCRCLFTYCLCACVHICADLYGCCTIYPSHHQVSLAIPSALMASTITYKRELTGGSLQPGQLLYALGLSDIPSRWIHILSSSSSSHGARWDKGELWSSSSILPSTAIHWAVWHRNLSHPFLFLLLHPRYPICHQVLWLLSCVL